jgi:hypothetical protein
MARPDVVRIARFPDPIALRPRPGDLDQPGAAALLLRLVRLAWLRWPRSVPGVERGLPARAGRAGRIEPLAAGICSATLPSIDPRRAARRRRGGSRLKLPAWCERDPGRAIITDEQGRNGATRWATAAGGRASPGSTASRTEVPRSCCRAIRRAGRNPRTGSPLPAPRGTPPFVNPSSRPPTNTARPRRGPRATRSTARASRSTRAGKQPFTPCLSSTKEAALRARQAQPGGRDRSQRSADNPARGAEADPDPAERGCASSPC